jgi:hypothetical protein|nr:type IV secretion system protein [uncultured Rhodopila sp.]
MAMVPPQTFEQIAAQYDPAIAQGVNQVITNAVSGNADTVTAALTVYVICMGGMMCFREMTWNNFVKHALRAGMISALMVYATFNTLIAQPAMETIPVWIAQTVNAQNSALSAPQQFDLLWSATEHVEAGILQQATGLDNIGYWMSAHVYATVAGSLLTLVFLMWEFSRSVMGLLVAVLPFVLFLYLFEATRGIPMRVFNKMIGVLILQLLLAITIQLFLQGNAHILLVAANAGDGDLAAQDAQLQDVILFFLFGAGLVLLVPSIAAYIGGGIAVNAGSTIVQNVTMLATSAGRSISRGLRR